MGIKKAFGGMLMAIAVVLCVPSMAFAAQDELALAVPSSVFAAEDEAASAVDDGSTEDAAAETDAVEIEDGLYVLNLAAVADSALTVKKNSISTGANVLLSADVSANGQKFVIKNVSNGYVRIGAALGPTTVSVKGASKMPGANVTMETYSGKDYQLWYPEQAGDGIRFVNKATGMALEVAKKKAKSNVRQGNMIKRAKQVWNIEPTSVNLQDRDSYLNAIKAASGSTSVKISNAPYGYKVKNKKWNKLLEAVDACNSRFNIRFIMLDCSTGTTVTCNPDLSWHAASTIKGLYATYLFEDCLETGYISRSQVHNLMQRTVGMSENEAYFSLRARFGTQSGFNAWLREVGIGPKGVWTNYSPRTLAKAWTRMLAYANSDGTYVSYWKNTFNHGYRSAVRMALEKKRTVYSKPGWNSGLEGEATRYHDGSLVIDDQGRNYLICFMSTGHPDRDKAAVMKVVKALDAIHMDLPETR